MPNWKKVIVSGSNAHLSGLSVDGNASITGSLTVYKSGSTVFSVQGSQGTLFEITDSLSGSLFSVSDISGIPILEVFSDDTVKIGTFGNEAIIVNGDTAQISGSLTGSLNLDSAVNAGTDTDKFLVLDSDGNVDFRTGNEVRSDIGSLDSSRTPQIVVTAAEVLDEALTGVYIPFSGINIFPDSNTTAYSRFHTPYDGYIKEIIVHPHEAATSGTCTITPAIGGTGTTPVQQTISATAGTPTTFTFGSSGYSFSDGDDIVLEFDREAPNRSKGFSFTIVFIMDTTS